MQFAKMYASLMLAQASLLGRMNECNPRYNHVSHFWHMHVAVFHFCSVKYTRPNYLVIFSVAKTLLQCKDVFIVFASNISKKFFGPL